MARGEPQKLKSKASKWGETLIGVKRPRSKPKEVEILVGKPGLDPKPSNFPQAFIFQTMT